MADSEAETPVPYVLSLLLCDQIYTERATGKNSLLGIFSNIAAAEFPARHPMLCAHLQLTDGRGKTSLQLKLVDANEERDPLLVGKGTLEFPDPRMVMEIGFVFQNIVFPEPGEYRFQVYGNDQLLMERRLVVAQIEKAEQQ